MAVPTDRSLRRRLVPVLFAISFLLLAGSGCNARPSTLEERAQALEKQIICPVCPGETLDQSQVQIARDMRAIVRERLAAGESEQQIKQFFVDRYGRRILADPPASGISLAVWIVPPAALIIGAVILYVILQQMRRSGVVQERRDEAGPEAEVPTRTPAVPDQPSRGEGGV